MTNPQAYLINKYNYFKLRDVAYLLRNSTAEFEVGWEKSTNVITLTTGKNYTAVGGELNTKALSSAAGKPTTAIVKGDGKYADIAAASVLAKTHRDEYMERLAGDFPEYGWERNKGYPTREHRLAIRRYGLTPHHRLTFNAGIDQLELF